MNFDTGGIQTHYVYLDFDDTELLQPQKGCLQHTLLGPAVHLDVDYVPISVFFGQAPPFAPILYEVQHRMQALARQTIRKLEAMTDADFEDMRFLFTDD